MMNKQMLIPKADVVARAWQLLTEPHESIREVGERRRARLLATVSLILTVAFIWATLSRPTSYGTFIALFSITILSYVLSRRPYYHIGSYFFCFSFMVLTFIPVYLGSA